MILCSTDFGGSVGAAAAVSLIISSFGGAVQIFRVIIAYSGQGCKWLWLARRNIQTMPSR
jgi:hypothetical protein